MDILNGQSTFENHNFKAQSFNHLLLTHLEFIACTFVKCSFEETVLKECIFRDCVFRNCNLNLANLPSSTFNSVKFEDTQAIGINWTETAWVKSKFNHPIDFLRSVINHSSFAGLDLKKTSIERCIAHNVDFTEANLSHSICTFTDFANSRFWKTNLTEADFRGAQNYSIAAHLNTVKKTKFSLPEAMSLLYSLDIILSDEPD